MSILIPELHERSKRASLRKDRDIRPQLTFHAQYRVNKRIEAAETLGRCRRRRRLRLTRLFGC